MRLHNISNQPIVAENPSNTSTLSAMDFAKELNQQLLKHQDLASQKIAASSATQKKPTAHAFTTSDNYTIKLGILTEKNSTVAELMLAKPELRAKTWSIIHEPINKNKTFHQIPLGSQIYYNQSTRELSWKQPGQTFTADITAARKKISSAQADVSLSSVQKTHPAEHQKMLLGKIDHNSPTVSNLLSRHKDFNSQRWNIIHSEVNKDKPFTQIPSGTTIYIDSKTKELSWTRTEKQRQNIAQRSIPEQTHSLAKRLDDAVKPFMGTEYKTIDCYTLVVHGLKNMGIPYKGHNGLSRQLLQMAHNEGRSAYAYFTGEGITEAMGEKIYTRAITQVNNIAQQSQSIYQEMQGLMQKGDILSFSLESKGHTGVISHNQDKWTYINSGRLDNSINQNAPNHGVGEETLLDEISNWIKLAGKRKESLQITVGRLDNEKLA